MTLAEESPPTPMATAPAVAPATAPPGRLSSDKAELLIILAFAYLPNILANVSVLLPHPEITGSYSAGSMLLYYLPRMLELTVPVLYINRLRGRTASQLGLVRPRWRDLPLGIGAFAGAYIAAILTVYTVYYAVFGFATGRGVTNFAALFPDAHSTMDVLLIGMVSMIVGFGEELFYRGYLIAQVLRIRNSPVVAVAFSTFLFGINHAYQGAFGVISSATLGLCYALFLLRFKRLWPIAFAHALTDFWALLAIHSPR